MKRLTAVVLVCLAAGCATAPRPAAVAALEPTEGSTARGTVRFTELRDGGVEVTIDLTGVPPGVHGFHVHEKGDCGERGNAAGGHFNPMNMPHGAPDAVSRHAGDFGNVTADANGEVHAMLVFRSVTVREGAQSVVGRAVVLHANPDDLATQPAGNAGARIACGVVQAR
ncbi:MAG TPA: superoxide dismutase family protein [Thermoanaerobaculia bacterium]|nr:superoxide dismutase family protein [Thermoanaerobaculia bacterium]